MTDNTNRIEKNWQVLPRIPSEIDKKLQDFPKGFRQLLYNRHIYTAAEAHQFMEVEGSLYDPFLLKGMDLTIRRLVKAINEHHEIAVYGDYDVDGISGAALLVQVLRSLGGKVQVYIPDRFTEGYGLNIPAVDHLKGLGVQLIVTVDCGIRSIKEAAFARDSGVDMIITDHHQPGEILPPATAVVNAKQAGDEYPYKELSGVGTAYKIAEGLLSELSTSDVNPEDLLDLVAIGTVADIVPLTGENRALVKAGLRLLHSGKRLGIRKLAEKASVNLQTLNSRDIGFKLGPRLNAAGRMESGKDSYLLLITENEEVASSLATKLNSLNQDRQDLLNNLIERAKTSPDSDLSGNLLLTYDHEYHQGVVGLVASRLADQYYRPAVVGYQDDELIIASCRSIPEFNITQALDQCADLLEKYGGHEMAAGFTVRSENLERLNQRLKDMADQHLGDKDLRPLLCADMDIDLRLIPVDILEKIAQIEPTGEGNPEVVFISRNVPVVDSRQVGGDQHLRLKLRVGRKTYTAIAFNQGNKFDPGMNHADLIYSLEKNEYNGLISTQLVVKDIKPASMP
jgi:single-stranded-DNA-specific exonuclease